MERDVGQSTVGSRTFQQHQFFPSGGAGMQIMRSNRLSLSADQPEVPSAVANGKQSLLQAAEYIPHKAGWDSSSWSWDSVRFLAQPAASRELQGASAIEQQSLMRQADNENGNCGSKLPGIGFKLDGRLSVTCEQAASDLATCHREDESELRSQTFFSREMPSHPRNGARMSLRADDSDEDDGQLSLKLGGNLYSPPEEIGSQNGKRCRSSSPQSQIPTCQVDECTADLSKAKEYHRRHKVCEVHSKAAKAQVSHSMQRFCQQCSRFHPLPEFDEGKRSCRRRLAGHNRRRRKAQPDSAVAAAAQAGLMAEDDWPSKGPEILNFLNILNSLQSTDSTDLAHGAPNDQNILLQPLKNAEPTSSMLKDSTRMAPSWNQLNRNLDRRVHKPEANLSGPQSIGYNSDLAIQTCSLLTKLATPSTDAFSRLLQSTLKGQLSAMGHSAQENSVSCLGEGSGPGPLTLACSSTEAQKSQASPFTRFGQPSSSVPSISQIPSTICARPSVPKGPAQPPSSLAMTLQQLVADQSMPKLNHSSSAGHFMPTSGVKKLLPPHSATESGSAASEMCEKIQDQDITVNSTAGAEQHSLSPENVSDACRHSIDLEHPPPQHSGDVSQSGSDQQSPGTSSADWEDCNHRITFKLFDRHPAEFPEGLRAQIDEWLAHRPSDLESYIKPGCVVLTIFLSMPRSAWMELKEDLAASVKKLLSICNSNFWCEGRILVQVERQKVLVVDGDILESIVAEPLSYPYIQAVRPLAIVAGEQNTLVLKGFNFTQPGTRVCCAYQGKFIWQELSDMELEGRQPDSDAVVEELYLDKDTKIQPAAANEEVGVDKQMDDNAEVKHFPASEIKKQDVKWGEEAEEPLTGGGETNLIRTEEAMLQLDSVFTSNRDLQTVVGRCFVEVECGNYGGDWKPVIVADGPVCAEICTLEDEIAAAASLAGTAAQREGFQSSDVLDCTETARFVVEEEVTCFLHELGWFFQRTCFQDLKDSPVVDLISSRRLKLLLVFSVERNWCAVVQKLLDILFEVNSFEAAFMKLCDVLHEEVSLLHRAVQRKCRPMVELLLGYVPSSLAGANELESTAFQRKLQFKSHWGSIFRPDVNGPAGLTPLHIAANMQDGEEVVDALTSDPCQSGLHAWFNKRDDAGETPLKSALALGNFELVQLVRKKLVRLEEVQTVSINIPLHLPSESIQNRELMARAAVLNLELSTWVKSASSGGRAELCRPATTACKSQAGRRVPQNVGAIRGHMYRPFLLSVVSIATLCVCVCLLFRAAIQLQNGPLKWEGLQSGPK